MSFNSFDVSPLTPCNDVQDILYDGLAMADFDLCHIQRGPSVPSHHDTIMYYLTDEELNYHLSVISLFPDSPYLPSLDYSSPSSSQDSYEEGARSESRPEQVKSGSTELIIKHYNPNGLPVVLNEDLEPIHPMEHTCLVCSQRFSSRYNHTRHMETHSDNRVKFPCHLCPKYFTAKFSLNRHIDNLH